MRLRAFADRLWRDEPRLARGGRQNRRIWKSSASLISISPGRSARAAEFGLSDASLRPTSTTLLAETQPDILFDVVVPAARHEIVSRGARAPAAMC